MVEKQKDEAKEQKKSKYDTIIDFHDTFLKAIKSVYPLGVLSSLSMTIAAFLNSFQNNTLVLAQTYAIAASLSFLFAFSSSLILKLFLSLEKNGKNPVLAQFALISCILTGSGIGFLFLVIMEFASVLSIARAMSPTLIALVVLGILFPVPIIINMTRTAKSKSVSVFGYLTIISYSLSVLELILPLLPIYGVSLPLPVWWGNLLLGSLFSGLSFFFIMQILRIIQMRKRKKIRNLDLHQKCDRAEKTAD